MRKRLGDRAGDGVNRSSVERDFGRNFGFPSAGELRLMWFLLFGGENTVTGVSKGK